MTMLDISMFEDHDTLHDRNKPLVDRETKIGIEP